MITTAEFALASTNWWIRTGGTSLKESGRNLHLNLKISFYGFVDSYFFLNDKDIEILNSTSEGIRNAVLEYMASVCALLASDLPSLREVIQHNESGMLAYPDKTEDFQETLNLLLTDRAKRICFSKGDSIKSGKTTVYQ